eukprot:m.762320 g.762320  ORF g.762320 m.762320 type:complete len:99 (-) comp23209_c0_seq6:458-754(-)
MRLMQLSGWSTCVVVCLQVWLCMCTGFVFCHVTGYLYLCVRVCVGGWLDYLAVGGRLSLVASQDPIPEDLLQRDVALPSQHFPSDHVPVVARCVLRPQ